MKSWLKITLKIIAFLALIPVLTFGLLFGGGYVYGQLQLSRHQRSAQAVWNDAGDALERIVQGGKPTDELPAPLSSMERDGDAWLFYLPYDNQKLFQWVPCGLMYCEGDDFGWRSTRPLANDWYFFWDA